MTAKTSNAPSWLVESGVVFVENNGPDSAFWQGVQNRPTEYQPARIPRTLRRGGIKGHRSREPKGVRI